MTPLAANELRFEINILCFTCLASNVSNLLRLISVLKLPGNSREKWANDPDVLKHLIECKWFNFFRLKRRLVKNYARALEKVMTV